MSLSLCRLSPFHLVFCHSFEAMLLAGILPQQGLSKWLTFSPKFTQFKTFNFLVSPKKLKSTMQKFCQRGFI